MLVSLNRLSLFKERFANGHGLCPGCAEALIVRWTLMNIRGPVVVVNATGCLEVCTSKYPFTSWKTPWVHSAFENAAATMSGIIAAHKTLRGRGKGPDGVTFVAFAGDGGTYDIGLQSLSGALERGDRFLYICLNNEGYMNTGYQRSSATPLGARTTTSKVGSVVKGKVQERKNMVAIVAAHGIPYAAQASVSHWHDFMSKVKKAVEAEGPAFIDVLSPCVPGWGYDARLTVTLAKAGVESCYWPLYEIVNGEWRLTFMPETKVPFETYLKPQSRFRHVFAPDNRDMLKEMQSVVDRNWENLLRKCEVKPQEPESQLLSMV